MLLHSNIFVLNYFLDYPESAPFVSIKRVQWPSWFSRRHGYGRGWRERSLNRACLWYKTFSKAVLKTQKIKKIDFYQLLLKFRIAGINFSNWYISRRVLFSKTICTPLTTLKNREWTTLRRLSSCSPLSSWLSSPLYRTDWVVQRRVDWC